MAAAFIRLIFYSIIGLIIAGCGVRVEVMPPPVPTSTPRVYPEIDYDRGGIWRAQARPVLSFSQSETRALPFVQAEQPIVYAVKERAIYLGIEYDATWIDTALGSARLELIVSTRQEVNDEWAPYDRAERTLLSGDAPAHQQDSLAVTLYYENAALMEVQAEFLITLTLPSGDVETTRVLNSFPMAVFDEWSNALDPDAFTPALPNFIPYTPELILDWRAWGGGGCRRTDSRTARQMCEALDDQDPEAFFNAAGVYLDDVDERTRAQTLMDMGYVALSIGSPADGVTLFQAAIDAFTLLGSGERVGQGLHNLAVAQWNAGDVDAAYRAVSGLQELRALVYDEAGAMLMEANIGQVQGETWRVYTASDYFDSIGSPLGTLLRGWVED